MKRIQKLYEASSILIGAEKSIAARVTVLVLSRSDLKRLRPHLKALSEAFYRLIFEISEMMKEEESK
jgi:hypothetical protein